MSRPSRVAMRFLLVVSTIYSLFCDPGTTSWDPNLNLLSEELGEDPTAVSVRLNDICRWADAPGPIPSVPEPLAFDVIDVVENPPNYLSLLTSDVEESSLSSLEPFTAYVPTSASTNRSGLLRTPRLILQYWREQVKAYLADLLEQWNLALGYLRHYQHLISLIDSFIQNCGQLFRESNGHASTDMEYDWTLLVYDLVPIVIRLGVDRAVGKLLYLFYSMLWTMVLWFFCVCGTIGSSARDSLQRVIQHLCQALGKFISLARCIGHQFSDVVLAVLWLYKGAPHHLRRDAFFALEMIGVQLKYQRTRRGWTTYSMIWQMFGETEINGTEATIGAASGDSLADCKTISQFGHPENMGINHQDDVADRQIDSLSSLDLLIEESVEMGRDAMLGARSLWARKISLEREEFKQDMSPVEGHTAEAPNLAMPDVEIVDLERPAVEETETIVEPRDRLEEDVSEALLQDPFEPQDESTGSLVQGMDDVGDLVEDSQSQAIMEENLTTSTSGPTVGETHAVTTDNAIKRSSHSRMPRLVSGCSTINVRRQGKGHGNIYLDMASSSTGIPRLINGPLSQTTINQKELFTETVIQDVEIPSQAQTEPKPKNDQETVAPAKRQPIAKTDIPKVEIPTLLPVNVNEPSALFEAFVVFDACFSSPKDWVIQLEMIMWLAGTFYGFVFLGFQHALLKGLAEKSRFERTLALLNQVRLHPELVCATARFYGELAAALGNRFGRLAAQAIVPLLQLRGSNVPGVASDTQGAVEKILKHISNIPPHEFIPLLLDKKLFGGNSPQSRGYILQHLTTFLLWHQNDVRKQITQISVLQQIREIIVRGLNDRDDGVRRSAVDCYWAYHQTWTKRGDELWRSQSTDIKTMLDAGRNDALCPAETGSTTPTMEPPQLIIHSPEGQEAFKPLEKDSLWDGIVPFPFVNPIWGDDPVIDDNFLGPMPWVGRIALELEIPDEEHHGERCDDEEEFF